MKQSLLEKVRCKKEVVFLKQDQIFSLYGVINKYSHAEQICSEIALKNIEDDLTENESFQLWYDRALDAYADYVLELTKYGLQECGYIDFIRAVAGDKEDTVKYPVVYPFDNYTDVIEQIYAKDEIHNVITITLQVTEDCNLACSYCYQHNKTNKRMSFEQARKFLDDVLSDNGKLSEHYSCNKYKTCVLEFIGGEPFLEIDLIEKCTDYFINRMIELDHPWLNLFMISISSNGTLWNDERVRKYIKTHNQILSVGITVDGTKELHDMCRKFPDGTPTYELAHTAALELKDETKTALSKITLSPENITYFSDCIKQMCADGYEVIHANFVFEDVWSKEDAFVYYMQVKELTDWLVKNKKVNFFCDQIFEECTSYDFDKRDTNWCGGTGNMICLSPDGSYYPCLRYAPSSVGNNADPYVIGDLEEGVAKTEVTKARLDALDTVTASSQSSDKCFNCPIGSTCGWCSAYNYECFHTVNKRTTYTCDMHKARALATCYLNNSLYQNNLVHKVYDIRLSKDECVNILGLSEYDELCELTRMVGGHIA